MNSMELLKRDMERRYIVLSKADQFKYVKLAQNGDLHAQDKLIQGMFYLLYGLATKYVKFTKNASFDVCDILAYAIEGVIEGIPHFDETKGSAPLTYLQLWAKSKIRLHVISNRIIHVPMNIKEIIQRQLEAETKQYTTGMTDMEKDTFIEEYVGKYGTDHITCSVSNENNAYTDEPKWKEYGAEDPNFNTICMSFMKDLHNVLSRIYGDTCANRLILIARYRYEGFSMDEIATHLGVTKQLISQEIQMKLKPILAKKARKEGFVVVE